MSSWEDSFEELRPVAGLRPSKESQAKKKRSIYVADRDRKKREKRKTLLAEGAWDLKAKRSTFVIKNKTYSRDIFTIEALALALKKRPGTIRDWITRGWLPEARLRTPPVAGTLKDAGRRLWTREEIEFIVRCAKEEGIFGVAKPNVALTNFTLRVQRFFEIEFKEDKLS